MPTQSAVGMCSAGVWVWSAGRNMVGKRLVLSLVRTSCYLLRIRHMPQKISGITLSEGEYAVVSEVHKE